MEIKDVKKAPKHIYAPYINYIDIKSLKVSCDTYMTCCHNGM